MTETARDRLIYLPGLDGTGRLLFGQPALFDRFDTRCIRYPTEGTYGYDDLVGLAVSAMDGDGPAIVLAESFGTGVALWLAREHPGLVWRMVLVNPFAWYSRTGLIRLGRMAGRLAPARPFPRWTRAFRGRWFFGPRVDEKVREEWWKRTADVPMSAYAHRTRLLSGLDLRKDLPGIRVPTLVVVATDDRVVPPSCGREVARLLPSARLIERVAGHAAHVDPTIDVAAWLEDRELWQD